MKILVTGGSGRVGVEVVRDLVAHGHAVISADQRRPDPAQQGAGVRYVQIDNGNVGEVAGAMFGCDAVIHLGAIPNPYAHADEHVFMNNVGGTFATFQAAKLLGIQKVVFASSVSALGMSWAPVPFPPRFAPIDESHPMIVSEAYGLSKEVDERIGEMFHRQTGMQVIALRFHWVARHEESVARAKAVKLDPEVGDYRILWGYLDIRDAASICRIGAEINGLGFEPFIVTASDTLSDLNTEDLIRKYAPATEIRKPIPGNAGAYDISKAKRLLGWEPKHSWRDSE